MIRPQPIGIFPFPANLLVASADVSDELLSALLAGNPASDVFRHAANGEIAEALKVIDGDSSEDHYNRFVLDGSIDALDQARGKVSGDLAILLEIAAFTLGHADAVPPTDGLDGELRAFGLMAQAMGAVEAGDIEAGLAKLRIAADEARPISRLFAAQITASIAEIKHQHEGAGVQVANEYRNAIAVLAESPLEGAAATASMNLGICYQEMAMGNRGALLEAVKCYQQALRYFARESHPEEFAFLQNNLALAYLSIPLTESSDQLRVAIAIQALREALKVYKRETHGELWASTQLNLANALQYAPTSHQVENLQEAVNLYEEILAVRTPTENPAGYARLLANQGNALAHLGIFAHAVPKLTEARDIFSQIGEADSAAAVAETLGEISANAIAANG